MPPTGGLACNPGMCPDWESNQRPFGSQASTQSTELHQPGTNFFYCYSNTVVPIFPPLPSSSQPTLVSHSQSPHPCPCPWVIHTCSLTVESLPLLSTIMPLLPFLWPLSVCSMFPCLGFYFARQFILFIRLLLQVRSYGIGKMPNLITKCCVRSDHSTTDHSPMSLLPLRPAQSPRHNIEIRAISNPTMASSEGRVAVLLLVKML